MSTNRLDLAPGEYVFREGDPPTSAFLIESGSIAILSEQASGPVRLGVLGAGDLLGEMAIIDAAPRTASARAETAAVLVPVDGRQLSERIENSDLIVRALLRSQLARYRNVLSGRGGPAVVVPAVSVTSGFEANAKAKIELETQLRQALTARSLEVRYQPIFDIVEARIAGYEALVRWCHPTRGQVSPAEFIALAEETSLIVPIGQYVLERVAETLAELDRRSVAPMPFIAVNVSGRQFNEVDMLAAVMAAAQNQAIDPGLIKIEVTESLTVDVDAIALLIERAHQHGIKVALDDFGTGFSNLGHLHKLGFDNVKLDQGFVRQMLAAPRCLAIVQAIVTMVHALAADLIAEGVESEQELAALAAMGCRYAQGYLIGKPWTLDELLAKNP